MNELQKNYYYPNGNLQKRLIYFSSGKLLSETPYNINGKRHGVEKGWFSDGSVYYETSWLNGELHGIAKEWLNSGQLILKYYLNDRQVSKEEYERHILIEKLSGLNSGLL